MAPFILRSRRELDGLTATLAVVTLVAGVCFLLVPSEAAFPASNHPAEGMLTVLLTSTKQVALQHNMVPSLHVGLSAVCALAYATRAKTAGKVLLGTWTAGIAASTLFIHQHHILDVVTGLCLAWMGKRLIYDRWLRSSCCLLPPEDGHA
jgi:membrane-associated phospholipid phosphatase